MHNCSRGAQYALLQLELPSGLHLVPSLALFPGRARAVPIPVAWLLITRDTNSVTAVFGLVVIAHMPFSTACMLE